MAIPGPVVVSVGGSLSEDRTAAASPLSCLGLGIEGVLDTSFRGRVYGNTS